jgi:hypothetical protein
VRRDWRAAAYEESRGSHPRCFSGQLANENRDGHAAYQENLSFGRTVYNVKVRGRERFELWNVR